MRICKYRIKVVLALFLVLGIAASVYARDKIVAIVNDEIITQKDLNDFKNFMRIQLSRGASESDVENSLQSMTAHMLDKLIEDRLILQDAKKNDYKVEVAPKRFYSIKPEESRVKARLAEIKKRYASSAEFQKDLSGQGLAQADIESRIREQLLMRNIIEFKIRNKILVNPEEVTKFYKENPKEFVSAEKRLVVILIFDNSDFAKTVSYELKRGANIVDLAKLYTFTIENMEASKGKDLRKDIEAIIFDAGVGEVTDPVSIEGKFYVFKLDHIIAPRQLTLSQVQDKIHEFIFEKKMEEELARWTDELRAKSYIKIIKD